MRTAEQMADEIFEFLSENTDGAGRPNYDGWVRLVEFLSPIVAELDARLPVLSIPSCWPTDASPQEPGVLTTTAKDGDLVVWVKG